MNSESSEAYEKSKANDGANKVPPIPSDPPLITNVPARDTKNDTTNQTDWQRRNYRMQFAIFIVAVIVMFIYGGQLYEMQRATNIAANNYKLQTDALHIDQRAWVSEAGVTGKAKEGEPFAVRIVIRNTGKTFAKNFTSIVAFKMKQIADPDPDFEAVIGESTSSLNSLALVAPNGGFDQLLDIPQDGHKLTDTDIETLKNPTIIVLIFGKIFYEDIFRCQHWTTFCYRAYPTKEKYDAYSAYNDADENECP